MLAHVLIRQASPGTLQQFVRDRQTDRLATIRITDTMARIFAGAPQGSVSQALLGLSLGLFDVVSPAKKILAEQLMFGWR